VRRGWGRGVVGLDQGSEVVLVLDGNELLGDEQMRSSASS
jgi:hypothetical protein